MLLISLGHLNGNVICEKITRLGKQTFTGWVQVLISHALAMKYFYNIFVKAVVAVKAGGAY